MVCGIVLKLPGAMLVFFVLLPPKRPTAEPMLGRTRMPGVATGVLPFQANEEQDMDVVGAEWPTPRPARRQRLESPEPHPCTPSTESLGTEESPSVTSPPSLPVVLEPSPRASRRRLRGKQPPPPQEPPKDLDRAADDTDLDWTGWPMEDDDPNRLRYRFFRRRQWAWMQQVSESPGVTPSLVERALAGFSHHACRPERRSDASLSIGGVAA